MCHAIPFSARALKKNIFFDVDIVVKNRSKCVVFRGMHSYRWRVRVITLFPSIFSNWFCTLASLQKFLERVWRVQAAHLHNAARALSNRSRCFQLSRQRWYCGKKQIECGLAWYIVLSTTTRVITVVKIWSTIPLWWRVSLSIKLYTTLNRIQFVKYTTLNHIRLVNL